MITEIRDVTRRWLVLRILLILIPFLASIQPDNAAVAGETGTNSTESEYCIEISISQNTLKLYEKTADGGLVLIRTYPVGTAVRGLDTYPVGPGKVTGIYLNPWWYPTPYSRQVFRERGIELPRAVPPGHPLNYRGKFKITLSHKTRKGAIYRIHGANYSWRVGKRVTGGCFAMFNDQGLELARKISVGTEVNITP